MSIRFSEEERRILLEQVWSAPDADRVHWTWRIYPYEDLYYNLLHGSLRTPPLEQLHDIRDVVELVIFAKDCCSQDCTVGAAVESIRQKGFSWLRDPDERAFKDCLGIAIRLWLFTEPNFKNHSIGLVEAAVGSLPAPPTLSQAVPTGPSPLSETNYHLSEDFSARNLERKGGFQINWTSQLENHLTCPDKRSIWVFRHARTLWDYQMRREES